MAEGYELILSIDASGAVVGARTFKRSADEVAESAEKTEKATAGLGSQFNKLKQALYGVAAAFSIRELIRMTGTWTDLNSRMKIATGSTTAASNALSQLTEIANRNGQALEITAETFLRNNIGLSELGISTQRQINFTEAFSNVLTASAIKGDRAAVVLNNLSKAMAGGSLQGRELNMIIRSGGLTAQYLAKGLGVTTDKMRAMGKEGKLTTEVVLTAMENQLEATRKAVEDMPDTITDAFVTLRNQLTATIGSINEASGVTSLLVKGLKLIAKEMNLVVEIAIHAALFFATKWVSAMVVSAAATVRAATAMEIFSKAVKGMGGVVSLVASAIALVATGIISFALSVAAHDDKVVASGNKLKELSDRYGEVADAAERSQIRIAAAEERALLLAEQDRLARQIQNLENRIQASPHAKQLKEDKDAAVAAYQEITAQIDNWETAMNSADEAADRLKNSISALQEEALEKLVHELDPGAAAAKKFADGLKLLDETVGKEGGPSLGEYARLVARLDQALAAATVTIQGTTIAFSEIEEAIDASGIEQWAEALDKLAELDSRLDPLVKAAQDFNKEVDLVYELQKKLGLSGDEVAARLKVLATRFNENAEGADKVKNEYKDLRAELYPLEAAAIRYNQVVKFLYENHVRLGLSIDQLNVVLTDLAKDFNENAQNIMDKNSETTSTFDKEWERATENMVDSLAEFFKSGLSGFDNFKDSVIDLIKDMVANMLAAMAFEKFKPFLDKMKKGFTDAFSGVGSRTLSAGGMVLDSSGAEIPGVGSLAESALGGGGKLFGKGGAFSMGKGGSFAGMSGLAGNITGGLAGFAIGSALGPKFGASDKNAKIGSALGSIAGAFFGGPIGAMIGGALGGAVAGALFGGKEKVTAQGVSLGVTGGEVTGNTFTDISRKGGLFKKGKNYTKTGELDSGLQSNLQEGLTKAFDAVRAVATTLEVSGDAFEKFNLSARKLNLQGLSDDQIKKKLEEFLQDAIGEGVEFFVKNTEGLSDRLKKTVLSFSENTQDMIRAFELAASIDMAIALKPVAEATKIIAANSKTATENVQEQFEATVKLAIEYDGTIESLEALATALAATKQAQLELVLALEQTKAETMDMFQGTAQTIRESLMTTEQLYAERQRQFDMLSQAISQTVDPAELSRLSQTANQVLLDAYNMLDETQRPELAGGFLEAVDQLSALVQAQADLGIARVETQTVEMDGQVTEGLLSAARMQMDAATLMWETAQLQAQIAQQQYSWGAYGAVPAGGEIGL